MAPDSQEMYAEIRDLRKEFGEFRLAVFRDHNALLKEIAETELQKARDGSVWEIAKRWVPLLTVLALAAGLIGSAVGAGSALIVLYLRSLRP